MQISDTPQSFTPYLSAIANGAGGIVKGKSSLENGDVSLLVQYTDE